MTESQRRADPYFADANAVKQPAVISLTSIAASLAVTMALAAVTGITHRSRFVFYTGSDGRMAPNKAIAKPDCNYCGQEAVGMGDGGDPLIEVVR